MRYLLLVYLDEEVEAKKSEPLWRIVTCESRVTKTARHSSGLLSRPLLGATKGTRYSSRSFGRQLPRTVMSMRSWVNDDSLVTTSKKNLRPA